MAGKQGNHIPPFLDQNLVHFIRLDDLGIRHNIGHGFPQICDNDFITGFQIRYIAEVSGTVVPSVTGNDTVGV